MPTTVTHLELAPEPDDARDRYDSIDEDAAPRRVGCSTFVELARRMGIRTDDAIRQFVALRQPGLRSTTTVGLADAQRPARIGSARSARRGDDGPRRARAAPRS